MTALLPAIATHLWQSTLLVGVAALLTLLLRANHARTRYVIWLTASLKFLVPFAALAAIGRQFSWRPADALPHPALVAVETLTAPFTMFSTPDFQPVVTAEVFAAQPTASIDVSALLVTGWLAGALLLVGVWLLRWLKLRAILRGATPVTHGRELNILRRLERGTGSREMTLLASDASLEPGIVGCLNPVILWPSEISRRMSDGQIEAILLHELAHVRRRDNLLALVHMIVQAVFWFHPLVWWIGARLVDERERACDEEVVRLGADPHQYAESILHTCEYAVESPLICVAGITGSDLKRRITAIVCNRPAARLGSSKLALLTTVAVLCSVGPIAAGALARTTRSMSAVDEAATTMPADELVSIATLKARWLDPRTEPQLEPLTVIGRMERFAVTGLTGFDAPMRQTPGQPSIRTTADATSDPNLKFEVASIKLKENTGVEQAMRISLNPGSQFTHGGSIRALLLRAYGIPSVQQIGGPDWIGEDTYIINAKVPDDVRPTMANVNAMTRALLVDRFKLVTRQEVRELPVYAMTLARSDKRLGPRLQATNCPPRQPGVPAAAPPNVSGGSWSLGPKCGQMMNGRGTIMVGGFPMARLADMMQFELGRPVVDRTGLTGDYVAEVTYAPQALSAAAGADAGPSLFTAIQEQLGLKLDNDRAPMHVLVIDSIARPTVD